MLCMLSNIFNAKITIYGIKVLSSKTLNLLFNILYYEDTMKILITKAKNF